MSRPGSAVPASALSCLARSIFGQPEKAGSRGPSRVRWPGGIVAVELHKWLTGISVRTGARFALPLAVGIAVGRLGCYAAGLDDFTYGTPTVLPWGHDFGDGILRHPVQLYESAAMAAFAIGYVVAVLRHSDFIIENGFYLALAYYGLQRFAWEFLKPYGPVLGPLTLFHVLSLAILVYAVVMLARAPSAFSSEVGTGSREENASRQEARVSVPIQSERRL
jgi:prolipoprotein diacylglyceryltransferase